MSATSTTNITVSLTAKSISMSSVIALRERVAVILLGCSAADAAGIRFRVVRPYDNTTLAQTNTWAANGSQFEGTLDLGDDAMLDEFDKVTDPLFMRKFLLLVENVTAGNQSLIISDSFMVSNNTFTAEMESQNLTPAA